MIDDEGKPLKRELYVPYKQVQDEDSEDGELKWTTSISWDAQMESAHKLNRLGYDVSVHRHGWGSTCLPMSSPVSGCVTLELTDTDEVRIVPLVAETQSDTPVTPVT